MLYNDETEVIKAFSTFFLNQLRVIKSRFPKIENTEIQYRWISIAQGIQNRFEGSEEFSLQQFMQLFNSLESLYHNDCLELLAENRELVKSISNELFIISL